MKNLVKTLNGYRFLFLIKCYTFIVSKNGYNKNKVYKIKDQKEVINEIVDFCQ